MSHFDDIVKDKLDRRWRRYFTFKPTAKPVRCKDGSVLSVQASRTHACTPKSDIGPYAALEVMFEDTQGPLEWKGYFYYGVYNRVPVETIREYIRQCGGEIGE